MTSGNAGTSNVYWSAGNNRYEVENKTGVGELYYIYIMASDS